MSTAVTTIGQQPSSTSRLGPDSVRDARCVHSASHLSRAVDGGVSPQGLAGQGLRNFESDLLLRRLFCPFRSIAWLRCSQGESLSSAALLLALPLLVQQPLAIAPPPSAWMPVVAVDNQREGLYRLTPERQALLATIRYAEGTWKHGSDEGYRTLYGGGRFESLERHPEIEVRRGYVSAAAGAYQFLPATWKSAARDLNLNDFGNESQDQAALHLVEKRGALQRFDREGLTPEVLATLAAEWASLPTLAGSSAYGQPVKGHQELQDFYAAQLEKQRDRFRA